VIENPRGGIRQGETSYIFFSCNGQHEWLILLFGIESNLFKLLCIEVIFQHNILFFIDYWYCHLILNDCFIMIWIFRFD